MSEGPEIHRSHSQRDTQILALCPKLHGLWDWLGFHPCFHMWAGCWRWCTGPELACHAHWERTENEASGGLWPSVCARVLAAGL